MSTNRATIDAVRAALSTARMGTYEGAAGVQTEDDPAALLLDTYLFLKVIIPSRKATRDYLNQGESDAQN